MKELDQKIKMSKKRRGGRGAVAPLISLLFLRGNIVPRNVAAALPWKIKVITRNMDANAKPCEIITVMANTCHSCGGVFCSHHVVLVTRGNRRAWYCEGTCLVPTRWAIE